MLRLLHNPLKQWSTRKTVIVLAIALTGSVAVAYPSLLERYRAPKSELNFQTVARQRMEFSLLERGKLESQSNVKVFSEVEDIRGDGIIGNAIVSLVENGSFVKKGDLIVVLDSGTHVERVDEQILETDQARTAQLKAQVRYDNQISINETMAAQAKLTVQLAELELAMFKHKRNGTHRLEVDAIKRLIDDTENELLAAKAKLKLSENDKNGLEQLFRFGYAGKSELDRVRLDYLQAQSEVAAKTNRLQTQIANLTKKDVFDKKFSLLTLEGALTTAQGMLNQVALDNAAELAKAQAELDRATRIFEKESQLLARYKTHLENCEIHAPQDGMAAYAVPRHYRQPKIELGATVWEGQQILSLPDLKRMQVETAVHETARNRVRPGLAATIRLEAFPERAYRGSVAKVDLMPDRKDWDESDTKVYKTLVTIDEEVDQLKPGMTAIVEFHIDAIEDAVSVPIEAVRYEGDETYCFVDTGSSLERKPVRLGHSNQDAVQVLNGLREGERVVTNPTEIGYEAK